MEELFKDLVNIIFKLFWANYWFVSSRTTKKESLESFYFWMFMFHIVLATIDVYFLFYK